MAHAQSNSKNSRVVNASSVNGAGAGVGASAGEVKPTTFHDFLGNKGQGQKSAPAVVGGGRPPPDVSPSATSDVGSERHVSNHLEGIPFYGSRADITMPESSRRFTGNKRSNSDSFMVSARDKFPPGQADSQDSPILNKLLRYSGGDRRPIDEETYMNQMRPISAARRTDNNTPKWDRATPVNLGPGPVLQYPPRAGPVMQFGHQVQTPSYRFKETTVSPSVISQTAADEGSRTGIKGSGISSLMNPTGPVTARQPSGVLIRTGKQKSGVSISEPEPSIIPSQHGTESDGRQMTIFYGGQAHVFDNVHPNKADVIMALAGSNGGSWCTNFTPKSASRPSTGENHVSSGENDAGIAVLKELHGRPTDKWEHLRGFRTGSFEGGIRTKENNVAASIRAAKISIGEKHEDEG